MRPEHQLALPKEDCFAITRTQCRQVSSAFSRSSDSKKIHLTLRIEDAPCHMEVDTGSSISILSWSTLRHLVPAITRAQLKEATTSLCDYQGYLIPTLGSLDILVNYATFHGLPVIVVANPLPLLELDWIAKLSLSLSVIQTTSSAAISVEDVTREFADVFDSTHGKYRGSPISLNLDPQVAPLL